MRAWGDALNATPTVLKVSSLPNATYMVDGTYQGVDIRVWTEVQDDELAALDTVKAG
ncbi:hypothetical protein [Herbidospora sp. RD11066]